MVVKSITLIIFLQLLTPAFADVYKPLYNDECLKSQPTQAQIEAYILEAAKEYQIDPALLWANAKVESGLNPCIISKAGAIGVMQLMPGTAIELGVTNPFDARQNIYGGAKFLSELIKQFKIPQLYLAAYNAGASAVKRKRYVPNYSETKRHLRKVLRQYQVKTGINDDFAALQALGVQ